MSAPALSQRRVRVLPEHLANRIAAGEVAERPAAVVKELIENALDAGARRIEIRLRSGGKELISIRDDGCGMTREDAVTALRRHATSKIADPEDLESIGTMGFRGEALPSVAAVSRMEILTRPADAKMGTRIVIDGGTIRETTDAGVPVGTTVTARDLFYNVPARRKFLRSAPAELRQCTEVVQRAATCHPDVGFVYVVDGRQRANFSPAETLEERISDIVGRDLAEGMEPVLLDEGGLKVRGLAGRADVSRGSRSHQWLFVNRRPVQHRGISGAVQALYRDHMHPGRYPVFVLLVEVDPSWVDVNIHPAKSEVRFQDERRISSFARRAVGTVVRDSIPHWQPSTIPSPQGDVLGNLPQSDLGLGAGRADPWVYHPAAGISGGTESIMPSSPTRAFAPAAGAEGASPSDPVDDGASHLVPCWQFARTYIFTPLKGDLLLVDQHVAHERVLFEEVLAALTSDGDIPSQRLLFPLSVELTPDEEEALQTFRTEIVRMGYVIEVDADHRVSIGGVPAVGSQSRVGEVFREFLAQLADTGDVRVSGIEKVAASFACKAAVKAGDPLDHLEMNELVDRLFATEQPFFCPHGRPIVVRVSLEEIERRFGRI